MPGGMIQGRITDEAIEQMRRRIGYSNPTVRSGMTRLPYNSEATFDGIRHYAEGCGDDNPLFTDREYGKATRWGSQIAPPGFEATMGFDRTPQIPRDLDQETRHSLRGVQLYHSGNDYTFYAPIRAGDVLYRSVTVHDVQEKQSEFAQGRSVIVTNEQRYWREDGVVTVGKHWFVHAERKQVSTGHKYERDQPASYTDDQLAEIEAAYENEFRRGRDTLWWEDAQVGSDLPTMVKGPLTVTDMINFQMGWGPGPYGNPPHKLAYFNRKAMRGFYTRNEFNAWDVVQRVHWEPELARSVGVPSSYDIGPIRWSYVVNWCTNFCGDDAWPYRIRAEFRRFNYMGDTTWLSGKLVGKRLDPEAGPAIDVEIWGKNQRGDINVVGSATFLLASREHGPVRLPERPAARAAGSD